MTDSEPARTPQPPGYVEAVCSLLGEHGPATPGLGVTMTGIREVTGRSRSTVYRHFETVQQANEELAFHMVAAGDGWQRRLLRQPVEAPLTESVAAALDTSTDRGLWSRCSVPCLPGHSRARAAITAWEHQWLERLEQWLGAHLAAHGVRLRNVDGRAAAVSLAALIEGHLLLDRAWTVPEDSGWHTGRLGDLPTKAARLIEGLTVPAPPAEGTAEVIGDDLPGSPFTGAKRTLLDELAVLVDGPPGQSPIVEPARLIAPRRLARRINVTERRIYSLWPTATDLNRDAVEAIGRRLVHEAEACIDAMLIHGVEPVDGAPQIEVAARALAAFTRTTAATGDGHWFQITTALHDRAVLDAHVAVTVSATDTMRRLYLAQLWVHEAKLRPDVTFDEYMAVMRAAVVGTQRLISSQPALATEAARHRDATQPLAGLPGNLIARSLVTRA